MIFLLFFLYRDPRFASASLRAILRLDDAKKDLLLTRTNDTIHATALEESAIEKQDALSDYECLRICSDVLL